MEGVQKAWSKISKDGLIGISSLPFSSISATAAASSSVPAGGVLVTRPSRKLVSLFTCSKLCAACFVAGVVVGYTLKRRVRRWAARLLRRLKDE